MDCKLNRQCKKYMTMDCNNNCYPYIFLHGDKGNGGVWKTTNVPSSYKGYLLETMPIKNSIDNADIYLRLCNYIQNSISFVLDQRIGIYLFGSFPQFYFLFKAVMVRMKTIKMDS